MKDYSSVGVSATSSKEEAGLNGPVQMPGTAGPVQLSGTSQSDEISSVTIRAGTELGTFSAEKSFKLAPPQMSRETETEDFADFDSMVTFLRTTFGA